MKVDLREEDIEMKNLGYKFRLWLETEDEYGMRFKITEYFKTRDEITEYINEYFKRHEDEGFSDEEIIDLEKGELIWKIR